MTIEDKLGSIREDVQELKDEVRELRRLESRTTAVEATLRERDRQQTNTAATKATDWIKWGVIISLILGIVGLLLHFF